MEEKKNLPLGGDNAQNGGNGNNGGGRRRRRKRHRHGGNGNNGGQNNAQNNAQNNGQVAQNGQAQNNQARGGQNNPNAQKNKGQNNQGQGKKQNNQPQKQNAQNNQNNQNNQNSQSQKQNQGDNGKNKKQNAQNGKGQNQNREENRKDTYVYVLDGTLYLNLTNKCSNGCDFCVRNERTSYYGHNLWLRQGEPTVEKVIAAVNALGDITKFKEAVFCGFGEPTYKMEIMLALCDFFHEKGLKTRLNTNGQGSLINKRDIVPELKGKVDFVNVSLNASNAEKYQKICRSQFREAGFDALVEFGKNCRRNGVDCRFSIVDCIGEEEVEACKKLAQSVNVPLYIRAYITDS